MDKDVYSQPGFQPDETALAGLNPWADHVHESVAWTA